MYLTALLSYCALQLVTVHGSVCCRLPVENCVSSSRRALLSSVGEKQCREVAAVFCRLVVKDCVVSIASMSYACKNLGIAWMLFHMNHESPDQVFIMCLLQSELRLCVVRIVVVECEWCTSAATNCWCIHDRCGVYTDWFFFLFIFCLHTGITVKRL